MSRPIDLNDDRTVKECIDSLESIFSGNEKLINCQDVQFQVTRDVHPLSNLLDKNIFKTPYILVSSITPRERTLSSASVPEVEKSLDSANGSPLRLQTFDIPEAMRSNKDDVQKAGPTHWPISVDNGRAIISMVLLMKEAKLPVCILTDGADAEGTVVLCAYKNSDPEKKKFEHHLCTAKLNVSVSPRCKFPSVEELVRELDIHNMNLIETQCKSSYDIYKSSIDDETFPEHQGSLRLLFEWNNFSRLLQEPPMDAVTIVEAHIVSGDMRSAAHNLFCDVSFLKGLITGLNSGVMYWKASEEEVSVQEKLDSLLGRLSGQNQCVKTDEDNSSPAEQLIMATRQNFDFTEMLWDVLKDCQSYQDLIDCLQTVFKALEGGTLMLTVHSSNHTQLAKIVRQTNVREVLSVSLDHPFPLIMLAEIGLDKLVKDHAHHFTCKELVTTAQLESYTSGEGEMDVGLERLEKLHQALELAVTLEQVLKLPKELVSLGARQALKYYENNEIGKERHTFLIPVQERAVDAIIALLPPSEWHARITSQRSGLKEYAAYHFTTDSPFSYCDISRIDDETVKESTYIQTTVVHQAVVTLGH